MRPGFADPVLGAQSCFRALMEAMARPGRVFEVAAPSDLPEGLDPAAAAVLLTLADAETPLWTDAAPEAREWLLFHTGAPPAKTLAEASLVLSTGAAMPALRDLAAGEDETPQAGATLVRQVASLEAGRGWALRGPGIEAVHRLAVGGLPEDFVAQWRANAARFPCGVDVVLCAAPMVAALPRSVAIAAEEG